MYTFMDNLLIIFIKKKVILIDLKNHNSYVKKKKVLNDI